MPSQEVPTPLGIKLVAIWAVITGIALIIIGISRMPLYIPLGVASIVSSYGLWQLKTWGLILGIGALATVGVRYVLNFAVIEHAVVVLFLGYLVMQRKYFPKVSIPSTSDIR